jgi:hypothetical protein
VIGSILIVRSASTSSSADAAGAAASQRADEHRRVRAGREHQVVAAARAQRVDGTAVARIVGIEEGNQNTGVEDDHRHSRRRLFR